MRLLLDSVPYTHHLSPEQRIALHNLQLADFVMSNDDFPTQPHGQRRSVESFDDHEKANDMVDYLETANTNTPSRRLEAPGLVRNMTQEQRQHAEKTLIRKIDLRLMPALILMYILNYLDRNNIASARLAGLQDDLALTSAQYETCVSILFVGYLLMQSKRKRMQTHERRLR